MLRSRWWAITGVLVLALVFAACGGGDDEDDAAQSTTGGAGTQAAGQATQAAGTQAAATNIKRGGTLNVAMAANPKVFDPMLTNDTYSSQVTSQVFEGLYKYDENLNPVPWLAEKVDVNPNSTEWTFYMRKGVKFHDGTEMNAEAVKFSMDRIRNNQASVGYADSRTITDVAVIDPYTVKVTLSEPFAPFPSRLTGRLGAVVSPTAVKAMGDEKFGLSPVGTGPFKYGEFRNDVSVTVTKFEGYWKMGADGKALPYMDRIEFKVITEGGNRLTALQAGDVDVAALRDVDLPIAKQDRNILIKEGPGFSYSGLWLSINKPPFDNKNLRLAVSHALDRDEINKTIYEGSREISYGPIPPLLKWAVDANFKPYSTKADPEKAKAALAAGGRPTGFEFEYNISAGDTISQQLAELMQAQLAKVGIKMNIQAADFNGVVVPKLMKQESNAYAVGLTGGVDPDQFVAGPFAKGGSFNFFPYDNPQVDDLIKRGRSVSNQEERAKIYKDAVRIVMEDSPYIYTVYGIDRVTVRNNVNGWYLGSKATTGYAEYWKS